MEEATNGLEAVRTFEAWPDKSFDLILMDLSMPVLDGMGAMSAIRQTEAERYSARSTAVAAAAATTTTSGRSTTRMPFSNTSKPTTTPHPPQHNSSSHNPATTRSSEVTHLRYPKPRDRVKMFALTGRSTEQDMRRAIASGADGYMVKPMSITTYVLRPLSLSLLRSLSDKAGTREVVRY